MSAPDCPLLLDGRDFSEPAVAVEAPKTDEDFVAFDKSPTLLEEENRDPGDAAEPSFVPTPLALESKELADPAPGFVPNALKAEVDKAAEVPLLLPDPLLLPLLSDSVSFVPVAAPLKSDDPVDPVLC